MTTNYAAAIDSNDLVMSFVEEAVWGTTPSNPAFQKLRLDSEGFTGQKSRTRPNEIDPSGQASAAITTKIESTGSLGVSVSPSLALNAIIAASLRSSWSGEAVYSGTGNCTTSLADAATRTVTVTCTAATFTTAGSEIYVGQTLRVVTPTLDFTGIVTSATATVLALKECIGRYTGTNSGTDVTITSIGTFYSGSASITVSSWNLGQKSATLTCTAAKFATAGKSSKLVKGQFIKVNSTNFNFICRVRSITSDTVIDVDCVSATLSNTGCTDTNTIRGACIRNGNTVTTFTFEKKMATALYLRYTGCYPNDGSIEVGVGDYLKSSFSFLNSAQTSATTELSGATYADANVNTVVDAIKGIGSVYRGNDTGTTAGYPAAMTAVIQKVNTKWTNEGAAGQFGIGSAAALGMRPGKTLVTGTLSTYFKDFTLYTEFLNETPGLTSWHGADGVPTTSTVKGYQITFCNATIMNPKITAGGPSQDVMAEFEIEGNPEITGIHGGKTLQIDFFQ